MKILVGSRWISAILESVNLDMDAESDLIRVEMNLLFAKGGAEKAASAIPHWVIHLDDHMVSDGERMLLRSMKKAKVDTLEERVAMAMMGVLPGGVIMVETMTEMNGANVNVVGTAGDVVGVKQVFFGLTGDKRAKVVGHFMGRAEE